MALAFQSIQPLLQASVVKPGRANGSVKVQRSAIGATRDSGASVISMGVGAVLGAGFCRSQARTKSNRRGRGKSMQMLHMQVSDHEISETSSDQLVRYMGGNVVVRAVCATELVQKVIGQHQCSPMAGIALGRALLATTLLANGRDEGESLQLRIQGDGPIGSIITEASSALTVRGMVGNPAADAPSVPDLVGVGSASTLRLTRTHPYWKRPYTGTIGLKCGEIAEDVAQYLGMSEQTPASMGLSVEWDSEAGCIKQAEGWLVTLLPGWDEAEVSVVEANINTFDRMESTGSRPHDICKHMMRELRGEFQAEQKPTFRCKCSKKRLATAVMMLGKSEVEQILRDKETVEAQCDWCGSPLTLTPEEVLDHLSSDKGQQEMATCSYTPRQLKLKEEELKAMPATGKADWS